MTIGDAIVLGVIQGLTEFLPVSSSGHLTLGQAALGWTAPNLLFDIVVHVGTLVAVVGVFRAEVRRTVTGTLTALSETASGKGLAAWTESEDAWLAALVVIATLPTAVIGLTLGEHLSAMTSTPSAVGGILIFNGFVLLSTRWMPGGLRSGGEEVAGRPAGERRIGREVVRALLIGTGQGFAVLRGLSRSGTTIALGLLTRLDREAAARFSFLLSIPAILGALVLEFDTDAFAAAGGAGVYAAGFFVSAGVGWLALESLLAIVRRGGLHWFAPYCWLVGIASVAVGSGG